MLPNSSTPRENQSFNMEYGLFDLDPVIETNEVSILHESLKEANKKIEQKNEVIEELKNECEKVTSQICQNWKECLDEKLSEIQSLKVCFN